MKTLYYARLWPLYRTIDQPGFHEMDVFGSGESETDTIFLQQGNNPHKSGHVSVEMENPLSAGSKSLTQQKECVGFPRSAKKTCSPGTF